MVKRGIAIIILSLSFMLLLFSCNKEVRVIQLSAVVYETKSGELIHARYSDDGLYTWWTKGASAFLEKRDDSGNWVIVYPDCVAVER